DEQVARAMPDVFVIAWTAMGDRPSPRKTLDHPAWQNVPAIKNRRVFVVRDEWLNTPGPPLVRGAKELFHVIHSPPRHE
ncbi:MAG: ABC transporter substrate-binding protein, partial [Candidatus Acidiferrales bacterium]